MAPTWTDIWLILIFVAIVAFILSAAAAFCCAGRTMVRIFYLLYRTPSDLDIPLRTISISDSRPSMRCPAVNYRVDHGNIVCPQIHRRESSGSVFQRRFYDYVRARLMQRYRPVATRPATSIIPTFNMTAAASSYTIDLDDLNGPATGQSIDRLPSQLSIASSAAPYQASTPRHNRYRPVIRNGLNRNAIYRSRNRRRSFSDGSSSSGSSGIGSGISSTENVPSQQEHAPTQGNRFAGISQYLANRIRRGVSIIGGTQEAPRSRFVRSPTPYVVVHSCSPRRRLQISSSVFSNNLLQPDGTWNNQKLLMTTQLRDRPRIRRSLSESAGRRGGEDDVGRENVRGNHVAATWETARPPA